MARFLKSRIPAITMQITTKYGPVQTHELEEIISNSDAIVLYVIDPSVGIDRKTLREIQIARQYGKPICVVASMPFQLPKTLERYDKRHTYIATCDDILKTLQQMRQAQGLRHDFWKLVFHLLNLADLNRPSAV